MAWTAPTTRITGELITAAIWNADIVDNLKFGRTRQTVTATVTATAPWLAVTSGTPTITLPTAWAAIAGFWVWVYDVAAAAASNNITIATEGAETIDGSNTAVINTNRGAMVLVADGTNWHVWMIGVRA